MIMIASTDSGVEDDSFAGWHSLRCLRQASLKMITLADFGVDDSFGSVIDDSFNGRRQR